MSENLEQYVYNDKVFMVGGSPITLKPTGKFPVVAEQQWKTLDNAQSFIDDINGNAIPGTILTVVADGENNGVYFVESVGEGDDENFKPGVLVKIASSDVVKYKSEAEDYWRTCEVGGVKKDTEPEKFKNKTMSEMFDEILYPTLPPDITQPSATLSYSGSTLIEVGTQLPDKTDFKTTCDRGSVSYENANGDYHYAGESNYGELTMNPNSFGDISQEKSYSIVYNATFDEGSELWDNKRNPVDGKYIGGEVASNTINIYSVYPVYVNTDNIEELSKQSLVNYLNGEKSLFVEIPAETGDDKFKIEIPDSTELKSVKKYNFFTKDYDIDMEMFFVEEKNGYKKYIRTQKYEDKIIDKEKYKITIKLQ